MTDEDPLDDVVGFAGFGWFNGFVGLEVLDEPDSPPNRLDERVGVALDALELLERAELRELREEGAVVLGVERILILHLRHEQLEERVLAEAVVLAACSSPTGPACRRAGVCVVWSIAALVMGFTLTLSSCRERRSWKRIRASSSISFISAVPLGRAIARQCAVAESFEHQPLAPGGEPRLPGLSDGCLLPIHLLTSRFGQGSEADNPIPVPEDGMTGRPGSDRRVCGSVQPLPGARRRRSMPRERP